ncbi:redox-regulated ATPase YchF, partial [Gemmatimonadota bacterium]
VQKGKFSTVEPNVGTVEVPDRRLPRIHELAGSEDWAPTFIRFVDIAGLVEGASRGEGLGNRFLGQIREVDAIAHVLRCFEDPEIAHVMGSVDPLRDREIVEIELALADLETVERRREKVEKKARSGEKEAREEMVTLDRLSDALDSGLPLRTLAFSRAEALWVQQLGLLTVKPVLHVANVEEGEAAKEANRWIPDLRRVAREAGKEGSVVAISSPIEAELAHLDPGERIAFFQELGLEEPGLDRLIRAAYDLLGLITFFTTGEKLTRAWPVPRGTRAPEAAGEVHTDFQRGFIRAEAIGFEEFSRHGSMKIAREHGAIRSEGKEYVVQDGDILLFRFNV